MNANLFHPFRQRRNWSLRRNLSSDSKKPEMYLIRNNPLSACRKKNASAISITISCKTKRMRIFRRSKLTSRKRKNNHQRQQEMDNLKHGLFSVSLRGGYLATALINRKWAFSLYLINRNVTSATITPRCVYNSSSKPHISLVFLIAVMIITITRIYLSLHQLTAINI